MAIRAPDGANKRYSEKDSYFEVFFFYNFDHDRKHVAFCISLNRTLAPTIGPEISTLLGRTERALVKTSIQL